MTIGRRVARWLAVLAFSSCASLAGAQSEGAFVDAFAGQWETLSHNFSRSEQSACGIGLARDMRSNPPNATVRLASTANCARELADVAGWSIQDGQIALRDGDNKIVALLGGNQRRLNGRTGTRNAITLLRQDGSFAVGALDCVYLGYTASCADRLQQAAPRVADGTSVNVLTRANMRQTPSVEADAMAIVPANTCLPVNECTASGDGIWCRARYKATEGWIKKQSLRLEKYPVVTFANGC